MLNCFPLYIGSWGNSIHITEKNLLKKYKSNTFLR